MCVKWETTPSSPLLALSNGGRSCIAVPVLGSWWPVWTVRVLSSKTRFTYSKSPPCKHMHRSHLFNVFNIIHLILRFFFDTRSWFCVYRAPIPLRQEFYSDWVWNGGHAGMLISGLFSFLYSSQFHYTSPETLFTNVFFSDVKSASLPTFSSQPHIHAKLEKALLDGMAHSEKCVII